MLLEWIEPIFAKDRFQTRFFLHANSRQQCDILYFGIKNADIWQASMDFYIDKQWHNSAILCHRSLKIHQNTQEITINVQSKLNWRFELILTPRNTSYVFAKCRASRLPCRLNSAAFSMSRDHANLVKRHKTTKKHYKITVNSFNFFRVVLWSNKMALSKRKFNLNYHYVNPTTALGQNLR